MSRKIRVFETFKSGFNRNRNFKEALTKITKIVKQSVEDLKWWGKCFLETCTCKKLVNFRGSRWKGNTTFRVRLISSCWYALLYVWGAPFLASLRSALSFYLSIVYLSGSSKVLSTYISASLAHSTLRARRKCIQFTTLLTRELVSSQSETEALNRLHRKW